MWVRFTVLTSALRRLNVNVLKLLILLLLTGCAHIQEHKALYFSLGVMAVVASQGDSVSFQDPICPIEVPQGKRDPCNPVIQ